jgi:hypothetical protein
MLPCIVPGLFVCDGGSVGARCWVVVVVVVVAGWSAQELRIVPRTGSAIAKISFFIIGN